MPLLKDGLHWFLVELYQAYFYSCWDDFWIFLLKDLIRIIIELFIYLTLITGKYVKTLILYEGHSVNSEIRCVSAIAYLLAESWCCLYKAPTFISHNTKETIS